MVSRLNGSSRSRSVRPPSEVESRRLPKPEARVAPPPRDTFEPARAVRTNGPDAPNDTSRVRPTKPEVVSRPTDNFNARPPGQDIDTIVLHHTADGDDKSSLETLTGQSDNLLGQAYLWAKEQIKGEVSAHYTIGKDGTIYQHVDDEMRAWHAGVGSLRGDGADVNDRSIGIEIVNEGDGQDAYTEAQYRALEQLVPYLASEHGVPLENVVGHKETNPNKVDPSPNFDFDRILDATRRVL
ncbi:N-acetylmuramoyl-L-alanine amidase [Myxococcus hansupus]|uniref:N-acetylmuramoyl-L-alanine amidase n=1 Tax=Pseudomyxococcus hansupus TaxID=1297742 RepID=A0A0H4X8S6_9BACT|nr:N-acetylmuramoyl-L-alanine amidase [Myxococcus hansupus]AKQ70398.1 N-acetylmuramoyl-L-alanine amidase [Myxococcus hansupus]